MNRPGGAPSDLCYYQPYYKQLTCSCHNNDLKTDQFLNIKLGYYVRQLGQEVRSIVIQSCERLRLGLDLLGVNPSSIPITVQRCGHVLMDFIIMDPSLGDQTLQIHFTHVDNVTFHQLHVDNTALITAHDVKHFLLKETTFVHQTERSIIVTKCQDLAVTDSIFIQLDAGAFHVSDTRHVIVMDNQLSINAMSAFHTKDSSNLYISCNRLPGDPVSPDCRPGARKYRQYLSTTSTSTTTLASTSSLTTVPDNDDSSTSRQTQTDSHNTSSSSHQYQHTSPDLNTDNKNILIAQSESQPLLYFLFSLCFLLTIVILVLLYVYKSDKICKKLKIENLYTSVPSHQIPLPPPLPRPRSSSRIAKEEVGGDCTNSETGSISKTKTQDSAPAHWIREIEQNKLFKKVRQEIDKN